MTEQTDSRALLSFPASLHVAAFPAVQRWARDAVEKSLCFFGMTGLRSRRNDQGEAPSQVEGQGFLALNNVEGSPDRKDRAERDTALAEQEGLPARR